MINMIMEVAVAEKVAVVGTGGWAEQHTRIFSRREDTDLVAVVGRDAERTAARAKRYGAKPYTDLDEMIERERPDLITVSLPNEHHFDITRKLIDARIPLLVEKPLVFDLEQADELLEAAGDLFFAINFNHRYAEPVLRARAAISRGELGEIMFSTWRFGGETSPSKHPYAHLIETQCHAFDMLEHVIGPIVSVMAQMTDKAKHGFSTVSIGFQFEDGSVGSLLGSYDSSYAYPRTHYFEVNGSEGRFTIEDTVKRLTISRAGDEASSVWEAGYFNDEARDFHATFDRHVEDLLAALRAGEAPPIHARTGRRALELALACGTSFETGTRIATS
jgi:predicted dehydrogenase